MYKTEQLLLKAAYQKYLNFLIASNQASETELYTVLNFGVTYSRFHLSQQARLFSDELQFRSNIDLNAIFNTRDRRQQSEFAFNMYIYSYAKALLLGFNARDVDELPDTPIFVGHGIFHRMLTQSEFSLRKDNYSLYLRIVLDNLDKQEILVNLFSDFPFLAQSERMSVSGSYFFSDPLYDGFMNKLMDFSNNTVSNITVRKPSRRNSQDVEQDKITTEKVQNDTSRGNRIAIKEGQRMMELYSVASSKLDDFVTDANLPLGNSALSITNKDNWWYSFVNLPVLNNISYHVCRANFIFLIEDDDSRNNIIGLGQTYLERLPRNFKADTLIVRDVTAITYLKVNVGMKPERDGEKLSVTECDLLFYRGISPSSENKPETSSEDSDPK